MWCSGFDESGVICGDCVGLVGMTLLVLSDSLLLAALMVV